MNTAIAANEIMYTFNAHNFSKIPGSIVAYWVNETILKAYENTSLDDVAQPRHGLATSDNARFLKLWHEVNLLKASLQPVADATKKWFPMNKGGEYRKWYGNNEWVINYENDGQELKEFAISIYKCSSRTIQNTQFYFQRGITWSALASGRFSVRYTAGGALFGSGGYCAFADDESLYYVLALMNNKVNQVFISIVSPTLNYEVGHIKSIPVIFGGYKRERINLIVAENIQTSKEDWDYFETSWDFKKHPLI